MKANVMAVKKRKHCKGGSRVQVNIIGELGKGYICGRGH